MTKRLGLRLDAQIGEVHEAYRSAFSSHIERDSQIETNVISSNAGNVSGFVEQGREIAAEANDLEGYLARRAVRIRTAFSPFLQRTRGLIRFQIWLRMQRCLRRSRRLAERRLAPAEALYFVPQRRMTRKNRSRTGLGLLAMATVFLVAFVVREASDEPAGAAAVFAVLFGLLGLKAIWQSSNDASSSARVSDDEEAGNPR